MEERYMFGDLFIFLMHIDFKVLSEYKNIIFFLYQIIFFIQLEVFIRASQCCYMKKSLYQSVFYITSTCPDEDFQLNQKNSSVIIISHTKNRKNFDKIFLYSSKTLKLKHIFLPF